MGRCRILTTASRAVKRAEKFRVARERICYSTRPYRLRGRVIRAVAVPIAALALLLAAPVLAADPPTRTARGTVVAVDPASVPPVIVVKSETPKHDELIIGATVDEHTVVLRGEQAATLGELKAGEPVTLRYVKTAEGLVARVIQVK
jgi:hypothetical protein